MNISNNHERILVAVFGGAAAILVYVLASVLYMFLGDGYYRHAAETSTQDDNTCYEVPLAIYDKDQKDMREELLKKGYVWDLGLNEQMKLWDCRDAMKALDAQ